MFIHINGWLSKLWFHFGSRRGDFDFKDLGFRFWISAVENAPTLDVAFFLAFRACSGF